MLDSLKQKLDTCQLADVFRLENTLNKIQRGNLSQKDLASSLAAAAAAIEKSQRACELRRAAIPVKIDYLENLPVSARAEEITELLREHQVLIVAGDTGSGKTTQLPKVCLDAGFGVRGLIGHTQPRRLAALSVANRIADELGVEIGGGVGSQIRFKDNTSERSFLKLMTDGILLAEIQQDKFLNKYEVLIIDEAHERSLNIDFLLGYLKQLLQKRKNLKLIVTSATIDVEKFSKHFDNAPIAAVSGRNYPVETRYAPPAEASGELIDDDLQIDSIIRAVDTGNRDQAAQAGISRRRHPASIWKAALFGADKNIQTGPRQKDCLGHKCCRNIDYSSRHQLCNRYRSCANKPLQFAEQGATVAYRGYISSERESEEGALWSHGRRCLYSSICGK